MYGVCYVILLCNKPAFPIDWLDCDNNHTPLQNLAWRGVFFGLGVLVPELGSKYAHGFKIELRINLCLWLLARIIQALYPIDYLETSKLGYFQEVYSFCLAYQCKFAHRFQFLYILNNRESRFVSLLQSELGFCIWSIFESFYCQSF